jgi:hypothetical protein
VQDGFVPSRTQWLGMRSHVVRFHGSLLSLLSYSVRLDAQKCQLQERFISLTWFRKLKAA